MNVYKQYLSPATISIVIPRIHSIYDKLPHKYHIKHINSLIFTQVCVLPFCKDSIAKKEFLKHYRISDVYCSVIIAVALNIRLSKRFKLVSIFLGVFLSCGIIVAVYSASETCGCVKVFIIITGIAYCFRSIFNLTFWTQNGYFLQGFAALKSSPLYSLNILWNRYILD